MANIKNFGLQGVASDVQLGKAGIRLINEAGVFTLKASNGTSDAPLTASNATLSGSLTLSDSILSRQSQGVLKFNGTAAFMAPVGSTAQRGSLSTTGMIRVNNDVPSASFVEYYNGTEWMTLATGGNTVALQAEIDAIETSLGGAIDSSGAFVPSGFTGPVITSATSFTDAIQQVADYAMGHDTLDEVFPSTANGNVIYSAGGVWLQAAPGSTSGVQAYDAGLAALAAKTSTGIMIQTGDDTYASRELVQPTAGITISNADGVAGNPTFALANDLAALEGLTTTGYIVRTADGAATTRAMAGTAGRIDVTNGDGVASDTNIDLAPVTQASSGNFVKVTLDGYGRVTGNTAVTTADITALVNDTYVNVTGDSMSGNLSFISGATVTGLPAPVDASDAVNKSYVDSAINGLSWKQAVHVLAISNIDVASAPSSIDGHTLISGNRVLLINQTTSSENGIYDFNGVGNALTRSLDADVIAELNGAAVFVEQGTTYANTGWTQQTVLTSSFSGQNWVQFAGSNAYVGGVGIDISGNVISAKLGAGVTNLPTGEIGLDVAANNAVQLSSTATNGVLELVLDSGSGLAQSSSGLKINAASVTNAMLANPSVGLDADSGTSSLDLGQTLLIEGDSVKGISTSVVGQTVTITAADASSSQKGVAKFNTASFDVTAGDVTIKAAGVTNTQLVNSSISLAANSGSGSVDLGGTLTVSSADGAITATASGAGVSLQLNTVDVSHGGTGLTSVTAGELLYGNGTSALAHGSSLTFDGSLLNVTGAMTSSGAMTASDVHIVGTGASTINFRNDANTADTASISVAGDSSPLSVVGANGINLTSTAGNIGFVLTGAATLRISGSAATYTSNVQDDNDVPNKLYVDQAIAAGPATGIKAQKSVSMSLANGTNDIGVAIPAGATVLRVKVKITAAASGSTVLTIGDGTIADRYADADSIDAGSVGMYLIECFDADAGSVTLQASISSNGSGSGTADIIVEYELV